MANNHAHHSVKESPFKMPDTYVILSGVALLAFALTFLVPKGIFDVREIIDGDGKSREVLIPDSFRLADNEARGLPIFASGGDIGLLNVAFEGLVSGSKWGASIGVFAFILIAGGAFGIMTATGAINRALLSLISKSQHADIAAIPLLFIVFSLGGAVFGMGEEAIPFVLILAPVLITMGYDSITAVLITYVATQIGFACSWMNPFSVSIAQGIAGLPVLSGAGMRIMIWLFFTFAGAVAVTYYALLIKRHPARSLAHQSDEKFRQQQDVAIKYTRISLGDWLIILILFLGVIWIIWGVTQRAYYLPEIATQFFTMGILAAIIGSIFTLDGMNANRAAEAFRQGAMQLLPAAMIVAFASGIMLLLGSKDASQASVLNTILYSTSQALNGLSAPLAAVAMFVFQSIFNFFVTSGSGQAALTMPLMAPLGDLVGVNRQISVLAFQLGDGFTNILVPTSASLMGCLGAARLDWTIWVKFMLKPFLLFFFFAAMCIVIAVFTNFS